MVVAANSPWLGGSTVKNIFFSGGNVGLPRDAVQEAAR